MGSADIGFISAITIGGVVGYIVEKVRDSRMGLLGSIGLGILGGLISAWLAGVVRIALYGRLERLLIATAGAVPADPARPASPHISRRCGASGRLNGKV
jgi:uncharacterized membrane protein YeaQ/YmgE (transglycosylase-associated protein family)